MLLDVASNTMLTLQTLRTALYIVTMIRTAAALSTFRSENNVISISSANQPWLKHQQNRSSASKGANPLVRSMIITMTLRAQEQLNQMWLIMSTAGRSVVSEAWNSVGDFERLFLSSFCLLLLKEETNCVQSAQNYIYLKQVLRLFCGGENHLFILSYKILRFSFGFFCPFWGIWEVPFCF